MIPLIVPARDVHDRWYGRHTSLTKTQWVATKEYDCLPYFEKLLLHTEALRRSTRAAVICGKAAATIRGIPILNLQHDTRVTLTLPGKPHTPSHKQWPVIAHYRRASLPDSDWEEFCGYRITTPERTFADICAIDGELEGLAFIEAALRAGYRKDTFQKYLDDRRGEWGITKARKVLALARYGIDSPSETLAYYLAVQVYPRTSIEAQAQMSIKKPSGLYSRIRVDLLLFGWLVVEIDGRIKYGGADSARVLFEERARETAILSMGYHILRFHPSELIDKLVPTIAVVLNQNPHRHSPEKHTVPDLNNPPLWASFT